MNWVGGVRNRIKGSLQSDRKVQKMYFERKQQERASSASANRHPSDVKISKQRRKHRVSQDVLSFKMQSEINDQNDIINGRNFRVVNLGPIRQIQATKNGVNGIRTRRVESVNLPVSPIDTPSILNLSGSPTGCSNKNLPNLTSPSHIEPALKAIVPNNQFTGDKKVPLNDHTTGNSTLIHLFGVPIERPVRNHKTVSTVELKHNYSVSSGRACRKPSCTIESCGLALPPADVSQQDHTQMPSTTDTRSIIIMAPNNFESFPFTKSNILNQKSVSSTFSPDMDVSHRVPCSSEPVFSYSPCALSREQWLSISGTGYNSQHDTQYMSSFPDLPSVPVSDISDTTFIMDRNLKVFKVNLVKSPHCKKNDHDDEDRSSEYRKLDQMCLIQADNNVHNHPSTKSSSNVNCQDYPNNIRSSTVQGVPFADSLIADAEFYGEVINNEQEEINFASSPHSPPKPVFLHHRMDYYSPRDIRSQLSQQNVNAGQHVGQFHLGDINEPIHLLNQQGSDVKEMYNVRPPVGARAICSDSIKDDFFYRESEHCVRDFHKDDADQKHSHGKQTYLVSSGLDCTPNEVHDAHLRNRCADSMTSLDWHQTFEPANNGGRRASTSSSRACNERKSFMSKKRLSYFNSVDGWSVTSNELTSSYSRQGPLQVARDICSQDSQFKETKKTNEMNQSRKSEWLSAPVMTSTPYSPLITETVSTHNLQLVPDKQMKDHRDNKKTNSATQVLLEMSILEKQRESKMVCNPAPATCTHVSDLESTPQIVNSSTIKAAKESAQRSQTYVPGSTMEKPPIMFTYEKKDVCSDPVTTSSNNITPAILSTSQEADNTVVYTPAQSISSTETRIKSPPSVHLIMDNLFPALDHKDICPNNDTQNNECRVACDSELDMDRARHCDGKVLGSRSSTDNLDCMHRETGIGLCSPVVTIAVTRKHKISTTSQTTPKRVQDAACSPIRVFSEDGPRRQSDQASFNDRDMHSGKIYCLRPRNKLD